jgi:homogentisate 1,2-dioxygenase
VEELVGEEGFASASSLLYHRNSPSALTAIEPIDDARDALTAMRPVAPQHFRTGALDAGGDPVSGRQLLAGNDDIRILTVDCTDSSGLYRDAVGDQLVYVQAGDAVLESSFGKLAVRAGDYVVVPRGVCHRWNVITHMRLLVVETSSHVRPPARYLTPYGQFREHSPYCERDLRMPNETLVVDSGAPVDVLVRSRAGMTRHTYAHHPFDVVGWDGCVYPWALSIHDFEPIVGSIHQPPPVHQTFEGNGFVICSFVPRLYDFHPDAVKIPYHHSNVDSDEVIYYSAGNFMSRGDSGIGAGSISLHPGGFVHGPQPGSFERSVDKKRTEELAVMIDTFKPLSITDTARAVADPEYFRSWSR